MCFELSYLLGKHRRLIKHSKLKPAASLRPTTAANISMSEINRKRLKELLAIPANSVCADCADPDPNYASITIGVFLCASCVQIHRKLGTHVSRTKSLTHDCWDQQSVSFMEENGNAYAKSLYERYLPPYYRKPLSNDNEVLKEQWIRAKYERKEFMNSIDTQTYSTGTSGYMEGMLYKKGKDGTKFNKRRFILSQVDCTLKYFVKDKTPKAEIKCEELNATFTKKLGKPFALQLTYPKEGRMRSIFVCTDTGKEIVDWYQNIRAVQLANFRILYPTCPVNDLLPLLSTDFIKEGFLHKTGSKVGDEYKRRWFSLHRRVLLYFVEPTNPFAKGEIYLQEKQDGFIVLSGVPAGLKEYRHGFTLVTPDRKWLFGADSEKERDDWIDILNAVINTPELAHDLNYRYQMKNSYSYRKLRHSHSASNNNLSTRSNLTSNSLTSLNIGDRSSNSSFNSSCSSVQKKSKGFFS